MNGNLFQGFSYLVQGFKIICQPGFRLFLLIPVLVNTLLFVLLIVWIKSLVSGWLSVLLSWIPEWLGFIEWLFWGIYLLVIGLTFLYTFVAAANLIAAPFYGYLAEKTEQHLTGKSIEEDFSWRKLVSLIPSTVKREVQKILYYLPRVIGLFVLGLIPGLNLLIAVIWILFSAWMMAIQYIDYPADNHNVRFPEMRQYLSSNRFTSLGFGLLTFGVTLIPLLNFIAFPAAVCGGVAFWVHEQSKQDNTNLNFDSHNKVGSIEK